MERIGIDSLLSLEIIALCRHIPQIPNQQQVSNLVLLANPALMEAGDPDHHEDSIEEAKWRIQPLLGFGAVTETDCDHTAPKDTAHDHCWDQPACVMDQPGEIERHFLSIVVFNDV